MESVLILVIIVMIFAITCKKTEKLTLMGTLAPRYEEHSACVSKCSKMDIRGGTPYTKWMCSRQCQKPLALDVSKAELDESERSECRLFKDNNSRANCECIEEVKGECEIQCKYSDSGDCLERCYHTRKYDCMGGGNWTKL